MTDLPHTLATPSPYITEEETAFQKSTDTVVEQKLGQDINYLKDQRDAANVIFSSLVSGAYQAATISMGITPGTSYSGIVWGSPNGKQIEIVACSFTQGVFGAYASHTPSIALTNIGSSSQICGLAGRDFGNQISLLSINVTNAPDNNQVYIAFNPIVTVANPTPVSIGPGTLILSMVYKA